MLNKRFTQEIERPIQIHIPQTRFHNQMQYPKKFQNNSKNNNQVWQQRKILIHPQQTNNSHHQKINNNECLQHLNQLSNKKIAQSYGYNRQRFIYEQRNIQFKGLDNNALSHPVYRQPKNQEQQNYYHHAKYPTQIPHQNEYLKQRLHSYPHTNPITVSTDSRINYSQKPHNQFQIDKPTISTMSKVTLYDVLTNKIDEHKQFGLQQTCFALPDGVSLNLNFKKQQHKQMRIKTQQNQQYQLAKRESVQLGRRLSNFNQNRNLMGNQNKINVISQHSELIYPNQPYRGSTVSEAQKVSVPGVICTDSRIVYGPAVSKILNDHQNKKINQAKSIQSVFIQKQAPIQCFLFQNKQVINSVDRQIDPFQIKSLSVRDFQYNQQINQQNFKYTKYLKYHNQFQNQHDQLMKRQVPQKLSRRNSDPYLNERVIIKNPNYSPQDFQRSQQSLLNINHANGCRDYAKLSHENNKQLKASKISNRNKQQSRQVTEFVDWQNRQQVKKHDSPKLLHQYTKSPQKRIEQLELQNNRLRQIIKLQYLPMKQKYDILVRQQQQRDYLITTLEWKIKELSKQLVGNYGQ